MNMNFDYISKLINDINLGMNNWIPIIEYMNYYKNDVNQSYTINYVIVESIKQYLNILINLNFTICYFDITKVFIQWIGFPSYYTEDNINYIILMCMKSMGIQCDKIVCNKICAY